MQRLFLRRYVVSLSILFPFNLAYNIQTCSNPPLSETQIGPGGAHFQHLLAQLADKFNRGDVGVDFIDHIPPVHGV